MDYAKAQILLTVTDILQLYLFLLFLLLKQVLSVSAEFFVFLAKFKAEVIVTFMPHQCLLVYSLLVLELLSFFFFLIFLPPSYFSSNVYLNLLLVHITVQYSRESILIPLVFVLSSHLSTFSCYSFEVLYKFFYCFTSLLYFFQLCHLHCLIVSIPKFFL